MKKVTALILALALIVALVPTAFAVSGNTYDYVLKSAAMGGSTTMPFSLTTNVHTYDKTVAAVSEKWQFEGVTSSASAATATNFTLWTKYIAAGSVPTLGTMVLALSVYVPEDGTYAPSISYTPQASSPKVEVFLVPKPEGFSFLNGDGTENYKVSSYAEALPASDRIGIVDMYGANAAEKTAELSKRTLTAGYYLLILAANGANDSFTPEASGARVYAAIRPTVFTLDSTAETAINFTVDKAEIDVGDSAQASAVLTRASGKSATGIANVSFASSAPSVADVSANGVITGISDGTTNITASVPGTSVSQTIPVLVQGKDNGNAGVTLDYGLNSNALKTGAGTVIRDTALFDEYAEISAENWAYAGGNAGSKLLRKNDTILSYNNVNASVGIIWYAVKLKVPNYGYYDVSITHGAENVCGRADVYLFPYNGGEVTTDLLTGKTPVGTLDAYNATVQIKTEDIGKISVRKRGEYILVLKMIQKNPLATGTTMYIYPMKVRLAAVAAPSNETITNTKRGVTFSASNTNGIGVAVDIATSLTSYTQGNAQANDVGTVVTATAPTEASGLKFRYWMDEGTKRVVKTDAAVSFSLGTNTKLTAVYAAEESGTLVEFFNKNGEVLSSTYYAPGAAIVRPTLPTLTGYGTAIGWSSDIATAPENNISIVAEYAAPSADIAIEVTGGSGSGTYAYNKPVRVIAPATSEGQVFSHWEKNGEVASYDADYTFYAWGAATLTAVYADEAPTKIPSVFIDSVTKDGAVMAEFVGFAPDTIIEKGIFFGAGIPSITSYSEKATATGNGTQFTAKPNDAGLTARAYAIYRDGATVKIAYSD